MVSSSARRGHTYSRIQVSPATVCLSLFAEYKAPYAEGSAAVGAAAMPEVRTAEPPRDATQLLSRSAASPRPATLHDLRWPYPSAGQSAEWDALPVTSECETRYLGSRAELTCPLLTLYHGTIGILPPWEGKGCYQCSQKAQKHQRDSS